MYPRVSLLVTGAAVLCGLAGAQNQTMDWEKQTYLTILSVKALPGQAIALADHYKTGAGAKTIQARIKHNPNLLRWTLLRNVYPGDTGAEADHMIAIAMKGQPVEPDISMSDKIAREAAGMSYSAYMDKVRTMTRQVGQSLSHVHFATQGYAPAEGDYVVIRRLKASEQQRQTMMDLARDIQLPLAEDRVKRGASKGWSFSHLSFPTGEAAPYDATEVRIYKDLASAIGSGGGPGGGAAAARFAEKFPNRSYTAYIDALRSSSKIVQSDLYRVVVAYRQ